MKEIKQITIKHPTEGEITVHTSLPEEISEMIGDVVSDFDDSKFYYGYVRKLKDGSFVITELKLVAPESFNVGFMDNSKGCKNFITVLKTKNIGDEYVFFQNGVVSVEFEDNNQN